MHNRPHELDVAEVARAWQTSRESAMRTLDALGIAIADYPLADEQATLEKLGL